MTSSLLHIGIMTVIVGAPAPSRPLTVTARLADRVHVELETRIDLPASPGGSRARLWVPLPRDERHQSVLSIDYPHPGQITRDAELDNRFVYFEFHPASSMPSQIVVRCEVVRQALKGTAGPVTGAPESVERWRRADRLLPIDGRAKAMADSIVRGSNDETDKARRIYQFVLDHMSYDKSVPGWGDADFLRACEVGKGNCTDFHGMFLALCRAQQIPARLEIGVELATDGTTAVTGSYHCWAGFFTDKSGWTPVDVSTAWKRSQAARLANEQRIAQDERFALFGALDAYRICFSHGLDVPTAPPASGPVRYLVDPVLEIDGKRLPVGDPLSGGVRRSWSYRFR